MYYGLVRRASAISKSKWLESEPGPLSEGSRVGGGEGFYIRGETSKDAE